MTGEIKALLVIGGGFLAYQVYKAQQGITRLTNTVGPFVANANQIAGNVAGITGSFAGLSNAAVAAGQGLSRLFGFSGSGPSAPSQPSTGTNSFQSANGWTSAPSGGGGLSSFGGELGVGLFGSSAIMPGPLSGGSFTGGGLFGGGFAFDQESAA